MLTTTTAPALGLDDDRLRRLAPSIFAPAPWGGMSGRYRMVPTIEVVGILRDKGFLPVRAEQSRARTPDRRDVTRHMIRFRHSDHVSPLTVGAEVPELVLVNSHDGTAAYRFMAGIFRLVCSNGMVVQSADTGSIAVRHTGGADFHERVIDATYQIMDDAPRTLEKIGAWKGIDLTPPQREAFAAAALELKDNRAVTPAQLLAPRRPEDRATDLWTTAGVVQEHLLRGGDRGRAASGRRTTTRPVKSVAEDVRLNRALWTLTERLAEAVS
jgi:hypothetical protein